MAQDFKFFDRLYQGFEAEYLVASGLFGTGLEAFKLPGDFGFDLLVSNQMQATQMASCRGKPNDARAPFPYVLQVKSRRARTEQIRLVDGLDRRELDMTFSIKESEYDLLISNERAFLVCVLFLPAEQRSLSSRPVIFWLEGRQLQSLREREYLLSGEGSLGAEWLTLHVVYRFVPMLRRDVLATSVAESFAALRANLADAPVSKELLDGALAACKKRLTDLLPEELECNRNGNEYVALRRRVWDKAAANFGDELTTARKLDDQQTDLSSLGATTRMFPVDDRGIEHWLKERKKMDVVRAVKD